MATASRQVTRETELKAAVLDADIPTRDLKLYMVLMKRAQWNTAKILDQFQPRSLEELAAWARMSKANVARSLNHLQRHGWVQRYRHLTDRGIGGRGHPTHYQLDRGRDCDCKAKAKQAASTLLPGQDSPKGEPDPAKGSQDEPVYGGKASQKCAIKGLKSDQISAGQALVSAKSVRDEGEVERGRAFTPVWDLPRPAPDESWKSWPAGSIGEWENR